MSIKVIKRDGRFVSFDIERIANAIFKAAKAVGGEDRQLAANLTQKISSIILDKYSTIGSVTVEDIQDIVEKTLIENGHAKTAKAYILYRKQRADARELRQAFGEIENILDEYLNGSDWRIKENSNTTFSLQGLNNFI
ncbi:MAG: ribonucleoside triphosphate reductase, partial [Deferribacterales bacterium]|nr:ribonucleoside triphosphate reductase [Deferribacterales bacterium]